ncbi:hypothetical protein [Ruegeria arenilitoris]|uniref:hypothetical protein n=1 Tax=Ruegeria arenilitoris TaxID=1173585 RepID=UPI00147AACC2|nr:hypothetical protein [Ruegeria arenilitoris]
MAACLCLCASAVAKDIQPKSGLWKYSYELLSQDGCPAEYVEYISMGGEVSLSFTLPFNAKDRLENEYIAERVGENEWWGFAYEIREDETGIATLYSDVFLNVVSETEIHERVTFRATATGSRKREIGITGGVCVGQWEVRLQRVGD